MKLSLNSILKNGVYLAIVLMFLLAGPIQFFIGVSSTVYSFAVIGLLLLLVCLDMIISKKVYVFPIALLTATYIFWIFFSGIYNKTEIPKILIYLNFALVPFSVIYLFKAVDKKDHGFDLDRASKLFRFIAILQLPIILIQRYFYRYLIGLNRSNQSIAGVDFSFGTFPIKADHALGFFLLLYILSFFIRRKKGERIKLPWLLLIYCSVSIFVMESNLTKVVFLMCTLFLLLQWLYKKISIFGFLAIIGFGFVGFNFALKVPAIQNEFYHMQNEFTIEKSITAVEKGHAKRPQVILYLLSMEPFKIIGDGPYNYYNILEGKFKKTTHFSQIIWTYNDLGLFGLLIMFAMAFSLVVFLNLDFKSSVLIGTVLLFYLLMTNVFSEINMLLSFIMIKTQKVLYNEG